MVDTAADTVVVSLKRNRTFVHLFEIQKLMIASLFFATGYGYGGGMGYGRGGYRGGEYTS
jgi:hypothetical protein